MSRTRSRNADRFQLETLEGRQPGFLTILLASGALPDVGTGGTTTYGSAERAPDVSTL
jgi:hypothetical protein